MSEVSATEAAVKLAEEHSLDLAEVLGSGANGRITKGDVESHLAALKAPTDIENFEVLMPEDFPPDPEAADPEAAEPTAERVPAVGDAVVYVLAIGPCAKQSRPAVITARYGATSDLEVTTAPGDKLASAYNVSNAPYDETGAPGTWHWNE